MLLGSPLLYHWVPREAPCYMLMSYISCLTITVEMEAERLNSLPKSQICYRDFYRRFLFKSVTLHMCALSLHLRQFLLGHSSWQCPHGHLCAHLRLSVQISEPIIEKLQPGCLPGSTATGAWKYTGLSRVNSTTVHNSMQQLTVWDRCDVFSLFHFQEHPESYKDTQDCQVLTYTPLTSQPI